MELLALLLVLLTLAALILPWVNLARISSLRNELEELQYEVRELRRLVNEAARATDTEKKPAATAAVAAVAAPAVEVSPLAVRSSVEVPKPEPSAGPALARPVVPPPMPATVKVDAVREPVAEAEETAAPRESQDWFSKLAIWVGGIALLMAGFYMIRYSIDEGLLTPAVRLWLTSGFGGLLCFAGLMIGLRTERSTNQRIGQALSGAGIACLYFAAYAAVHLYGFLTPTQGFGAMIAVTVLAVGLSLKSGPPVALLGLIGGFLTPWMMSTGSKDTELLFGYLFLLFCGAQFLCLRRGWWALLLVSLLGVYFWSATVIAGHLLGFFDDSRGAMVFVLGICFANALWAFLVKTDSQSPTTNGLVTAIRLLTWGGGLVQGLVLLLLGGFAGMDMLFFAVLAVGALSLAVLREEAFIWSAWLAWVGIGATAVTNAEQVLWSWLLLPLGLAVLFFLTGHWKSLRSPQPLVWRSLSVIAAFFIVPLLYVNRIYLNGLESVVLPSFWLVLSVGFAALLVAAGEHILRREGDGKLAGEYSVAAVLLFGFGLWTFLPAVYHPHAAALLALGGACYWGRRPFDSFGKLAAILGMAWAFWMAPSALATFWYFFGKAGFWDGAPDGLVLMAWALGLLALVALLLGKGLDWSEAARKWIAWIFGVCGLLAFVAAYQWLDQEKMPEAWPEVAVEGGLTALLALGAVLFAGFQSKASACIRASFVLAILAGVRVCYLHLGDRGAEGPAFFFNALLLQFGIPTLAACFLAFMSARQGHESFRRFYQIAAMLLGFVWATFLVQDFFGGSRLVDSRNSSTEIYTYSVVWLLLAIVYQAIGLIRRQSVIHVGSLLLLLLTVGKVFLVDAAHLEGLFRVLSFLLLGFALIGIGYFYNKVVFARRAEADAG